MGWLQLRLRAWFGWHNIYNGMTCHISEQYREVHDYPKDKGGDGTPDHFHTYTCPVCGREFTI